MKTAAEKTPAELVRENPNCNYFISASAGTGKTFTLTSYYLGILELHERLSRPDVVDGILAVTFTNKAANEMKDRIMAEIRRKLENLKDSPSRQSVHYWRQVYSNMSRAVISTIDSLCRRILVEQNIIAGVDPSFTIINELKQLKVIDNVSRLAVEIAFKIYDGEKVDFHPFITSERRSLLKAYVAELEANREAIIQLFQVVGDIERVRKYVAEIVKNWRLELSMSKVSEKLLAVLASAGRSLQVLRTIGLIACQLYEAETLDNFEYDFKGVLEKVLAVLENDAVRRHYQERFKYIIVDEFQDTNDLQKKLFDTLHADGNYVFYVGDRKQSIYRFRGADVSVFVRTLAEFEERQRREPERYKILALQTNYRSHRQLVDYFNAVSEHSVFNSKIYEEGTVVSNSGKESPRRSQKSKVSEANIDKTIYRYEVFRLRFPELYGKLWFLPEDVSLAANQGAELEILPEVPAGDGVSFSRVNYLSITDSKGDKVELEAKLVASVIKHLHGKEMTFFEKTPNGLRPITRKISYSDFAILSYRLSTVENTYRDVFAKLGIPLYVVKGRAFYRRPEIRSVVSALNVIQNPNSNYNFVEFFFSPFVESVDVSERFEKFKVFHRIVSHARTNRERTDTYSFFQSAKELSELGELPPYVSEMVRLVQKYDELKYFLRPAEVLKGFVKESKYLEKLAKFDGAEQKMKNVKKLLDQASEFNQQASTFLELTRLMERINELQETEASELSEEDDVVRLMTVHSSKGLEYNIVFVVDNDFSERDDEKVTFPYTDEMDGRYVYIKNFIKKFESEIDTGSEEFRELMKQLEAELVYDETELLRKIYVAVTRAKEMLFVVVNASSGDATGKARRFLDPSNLPPEFHRSGLFGQFGFSSEEIERSFEELVGETAQIAHSTADVEVDDGKVFRTLADLRSTAYKRYLSPTVLWGIQDEKSESELEGEVSGEAVDEVSTHQLSSFWFEIRDTAGLSRLRWFVEAAPEVLEGKEVHKKLLGVNEYSQLENLVETKKVPEALLKARVLKQLFERATRVFSEWRIARHYEFDGRRYVLFGVPDKVFFTHEGIYVVDFKNAFLRDDVPETEKYKFQLLFYMWLLRDFGDVRGGYLISTRTGYTMHVDPPGDGFEAELRKLIRRFELAGPKGTSAR